MQHPTNPNLQIYAWEFSYWPLAWNPKGCSCFPLNQNLKRNEFWVSLGEYVLTCSDAKPLEGLLCLWMKETLVKRVDLTTLSNSLTSYNSLLVESFGFPRKRIMTPANRDHFNSSFLIWIPLFLFSCLIDQVRTSNTILNRSGEIGHPCIVPVFSGMAYSFPPLVWCWYWSFAYCFKCVAECSFYTNLA